MSSERNIRIRFGGDAEALRRATRAGERAVAGWQRQLDRARGTLGGATRASDEFGRAAARSSREAAHAARSLDRQIDELTGSLRSLAVQYANTGDDAFTRQIRAQERELRKLTRTRRLLGDDDDDSRGTAVKFGARLAGNIAEGLASAGAGISGALGKIFGTLPPQAQAAIGAGVIAAILAASTLIGAALVGAMLAGLGTGALAAGVMLAVRDPRIKDAGGELGKMVMSGLEDAAGVFVSPVLKSIGIIKDGWRGIAPDIKSAFSKVAPYVDNLARGLVTMVRRMMPGLLSALDKVGPILSMIGDELGNLGWAFGQFFRDIGSGANGGRLALQLFFKLIEVGIVATGKTLAMLSGTFENFAFLFAVSTGNVGLAMDILKGKTGHLAEKNDETGSSFQRLTDAQQREILALGSGSVALQGFRDRTEIMNSSMQGAIEKAGSLAAALNLLNGKNVSAQEAASNYQAAIDAVSESLKQNGNSLKNTDASGRANLATLRGLAAGAVANASAIYEQTAQTGNTALAQQKATAAYNQGRGELIKAYLQFDNNKARAKAYADSIMKIPTSWTTKPKFDATAATSAITTFQRKINGIDGRVITVTAVVNDKGIRTLGQGTQLRRWGGIDHHMAGGGTIESHFVKSPTVLYGERATKGEAFIPRNGNLARSRRTAETVVRDWLGGDVSWATQRGTAPAGVSGGADPGGVGTHVYVTIDGQQLEGRIDRVVRERDRGLKRRAGAGAGR